MDNGPRAAGEPSRRESVARGAVPRIGEETTAEATGPSELFDPAATGRVIGLWILTPSFSAAVSYRLFRFVLVP